jgi:hypothetical protein
MFSNRTKKSTNWGKPTIISYWTFEQTGITFDQEYLLFESIQNTSKHRVNSTLWTQIREFFYKTWYFGSRNVKFGSYSYNFGGTDFKEEQTFTNRTKPKE